MLFLVTWDFRDPSDEMQKQTLGLFSMWQPGPAVFQGFYGFANGDGGVAIAESEDAATIARTVAPWTPWLSFKLQPILPIQDSTAINGEALAWRQANY
jgi:hypothetical protein